MTDYFISHPTSIFSYNYLKTCFLYFYFHLQVVFSSKKVRLILLTSPRTSELTPSSAVSSLLPQTLRIGLIFSYDELLKLVPEF